MTAARREATTRNWKLYLLRGWYVLAQIYDLKYVRRACAVEIERLGGKP